MDWIHVLCDELFYRSQQLHNLALKAWRIQDSFKEAGCHLTKKLKQNSNLKNNWLQGRKVSKLRLVLKNAANSRGFLKWLPDLTFTAHVNKRIWSLCKGGVPRGWEEEGHTMSFRRHNSLVNMQSHRNCDILLYWYHWRDCSRDSSSLKQSR